MSSVGLKFYAVAPRKSCGSCLTIHEASANIQNCTQEKNNVTVCYDGIFFWKKQRFDLWNLFQNQNANNIIYVQMHNKKEMAVVALNFLAEIKHIASVNEARDTLARLVDYIKFRPLETGENKVTYDSMAVRDLGINTAAVKLIKFFQQVVKKDPSATMFLQLLKQYFLNAYDWSDLKQEGYNEFETDALWFCDEMDEYLRKMTIFSGGAMKKRSQPMGEKVLRRRVDAEQK